MQVSCCPRHTPVSLHHVERNVTQHKTRCIGLLLY